MADQTELLAEADRAFITAMQGIDAESDASAKELSDQVEQMRTTFSDEVKTRLKDPLRLEPNVDADKPDSKPASG